MHILHNRGIFSLNRVYFFVCVDQNALIEIYQSYFLTTNAQNSNGPTNIKISTEEDFKLWFN